MAETNTFLIARILGISSSLFLSGFAFSASYYTSAAISLSPIPLRLKQWQVVYDLGKLVSPPVSTLSALLWGFSAWTVHKNGGQDVKFYAVAGLATFANVPWTVGVMMPTNSELLRRSKAAAEGADGTEFEEGSLSALKRWDALNYMRAVMPMVGAWVGLWAALK